LGKRKGKSRRQFDLEGEIGGGERRAERGQKGGKSFTCCPGGGGRGSRVSFRSRVEGGPLRAPLGRKPEGERERDNDPFRFKNGGGGLRLAREVFFSVGQGWTQSEAGGKSEGGGEKEVLLILYSGGGDACRGGGGTLLATLKKFSEECPKKYRKGLLKVKEDFLILLEKRRRLEGEGFRKRWGKEGI